MSNDFILPDIGEGIVECELLKWLVKEGDVITEDQPVAEVMTDKATVEIPAMHDGVVEKLYYAEGDIAKVHKPLFSMAEAEPATVSDSKLPSVENERSEQVAQQTEVFLLPDIGEGIVECEIVKWCVSENELVEEDQVVVEVMTDKAVVEIPAKHAGKITKLYYGEGEIAKVHAPLFDISFASEGTLIKAAIEKDIGDSDKSTAKKPSTMNNSNLEQGENSIPKIESTRPIASPAVRRMAREKGIDLNQIKGSGAKGRILKKDVIDVTLSDAVKNTSAKADVPVTPAQIDAPSSIVEPLKGMRAAMMRQMKDSVSTIPHFSVSDELEMDNLIAMRNKLKPVFEKQGVKLTFMPFFIKALSLALNEFPVINARVSDDEKEIHFMTSHNIGLAVDSKLGLLVPNVKDVQNKSLRDIAVDVNRMVEAGREGRLSSQDLSGGTISISNIGSIGGITATPIINKPDVAIVALGKTRKLPRFDENDNVVATHIMHINWSGDHRVIDGATMVKFNNLWMDYLKNPEKMLIDLR